MHSEGMTPSDLRWLAEAAAGRSETPQRLLSHWLNSPYRWRDVLLDKRLMEERRVVRRDDEDGLKVKLPQAIRTILERIGL
jgi:hypothetical protein